MPPITSASGNPNPLKPVLQKQTEQTDATQKTSGLSGYKEVKPSASFAQRIADFFRGIAAFFFGGGAKTPSAESPSTSIGQASHTESERQTVAMPTQQLVGSDAIGTSSKRSVADITQKWCSPTQAFIANTTLSGKSISELKDIAKQLDALSSHLETKKPETTAQKEGLSPEDTQKLSRAVQETKVQIAAMQKALDQATTEAIHTLAHSLTDPLLTLVNDAKNAPETASFGTLKTLKNAVQEGKNTVSAKALSQVAKRLELTHAECDQLKTALNGTLEQVRAFEQRVAVAAPNAALSEVITASGESLKTVSLSHMITELATLGCDSSAQHAVEQSIHGLQHLVTHLGTKAADMTVASFAHRTGTQLGEDLYASVSSETRLAFAKLYADGVLSTNKEGVAFIQQLGVHMRLSPEDNIAQKVASGDYTTLNAMGGSNLGAMMGVRLESFDTLNLKLAMHQAPTSDAKAMVLTKHGLHQTIQKLAHSVTLIGVDGKDTKINPNAFKFDARTVNVLMQCAKPEDKKAFDLLFAYAMILQDKVDTGVSLSGPPSPEVAQQLQTILGLSSADEVTQLVQTGFKSQEEVSQALLFMTRFAAQLGTREDVQKTMMSLVSSPMDALDQFEGALYRSAMNVGGMDVQQASGALRGILSDASQTPAAVLAAQKRSMFEKISDLGHTASTKLFDLRKGIHDQSSRLNRLAEDNQKLGKILETIAKAEETLSEIASVLQDATPLPKGIEIQHVRQVVNADLAKVELAALTDFPLSTCSGPIAGMAVVPSEVLAAKLGFATLPSMLSMQSSYSFKQQDMPTVIRPEQRDGVTFLAVYERKPDVQGRMQEALIGYLDPKRDSAFLKAYIKQATASIQHADQAKHNADVRTQLSDPEKRDTALQIQRCQSERQVQMGILHDAREAQTARQQKIDTLFRTESTAFKSEQNAVRVAIAEYVRDELAGVSRAEMLDKMDALVEDMQADAAAIDPKDAEILGKIAEKLALYQGAEVAETLMPLIQAEVRSFEGATSFTNWAQEYQVTGSQAKKDFAAAEQVRGSVRYQHTRSLESATALLDSLRSEGETVSLQFGKRIEANTATVSRAGTAAVTGGLVQAGLAGKSENTQDIALVKTADGYQIQLSNTQLKEFGLETIFADLATVTVSAGGTSQVGYHLDFDTSEKAAQFLGALTSGNMEGMGSAGCLGLPSAVNLATGQSLYAGINVGLQIAPPVPGLKDPLNFGSVGMSVSGGGGWQTVDTQEGQVQTRTLSFSGSFSYDPEGVGHLVSAGTKAGVSALQSKGVLDGTVSGEATVSRSQSVSVLTAHDGRIGTYQITDTVACNLFGINEANLSRIAELAVGMALKGKEDKGTFQDKLDVITEGRSEVKKEILDLLSRAEAGQDIAITRVLPEDTVRDLNDLLNPITAKGVPKSQAELKADKAQADAIIQDPKSYKITSFSLLSVDQTTDHSQINVIKGIETTGTGVVDVTQIATGQRVTQDTVRL